MDNNFLIQVTSMLRISKKYRYNAIKRKEQSKVKIQKTRQLQEIKRHKWQENMNLY